MPTVDGTWMDTFRYLQTPHHGSKQPLLRNFVSRFPSIVAKRMRNFILVLTLQTRPVLLSTLPHMSCVQRRALPKPTSVRNGSMPNKTSTSGGFSGAPHRQLHQPAGVSTVGLSLIVVFISLFAVFLVSLRTPNVWHSSQRTMKWRLGHFGSRSAQVGEPSADDVAAGNAFAFELFKELGGDTVDVFISPVSVAAALGMTLAGSTANSPVEKELVKLLHGNLDSIAKLVHSSGAQGETKDGDMVKVLMANSAWLNADVKKEYAAEVGNLFGAEVLPLPKSPAPVNNWVKKATHGMITSLLDSIDARTVALLLNAVFFKGAWTHAFNPEDTSPGEFRAHGGDVKSVRMMRKQNVKFCYGEAPLGNGKLRIVELPYGKSEEFSALVILPADGASLPQAVDNISSWDSWMTQLSSSPVLFGILAMPRFKVEYGATSLKPALQALGLRSAWEEDKTPGKFNRMTADETVYLSDVVHKAAVEVTEEGTTAAAASAAIMNTRSIPVHDPVRMIVDKPFLFGVRNKEKGTIMFLGRVDNPRNPE